MNIVERVFHSVFPISKSDYLAYDWIKIKMYNYKYEKCPVNKYHRNPLILGRVYNPIQ